MKRIIDFIFPLKCPFCRDIINYNENHCKKCYDEIISSGKDEIIKDIINEKYFDYILFALLYNEKTKNSIVNFKNYNNTLNNYKQDAIIFIDIFLQKNNEFDFSDYDIVCDVASSNNKKSHSYYLAKEFSKRINKKYQKIFNKSKNDKKQHTLSFKDRIDNAKNMFSIIEGVDVKNKNIIIFDDVITTGSTVNELSKILKQKMSGKICVCSICRTKYNGGQNVGQ